VKGELLFAVLCDYQQHGVTMEKVNPHQLIVWCKVLYVQVVVFKLIAVNHCIHSGPI
jgi:hypothetical protein